MISLVLICGFLIVAVVLRILVQYQKTGDLGVRAASVHAPMIEILPGTIFVLTFCFALVLVVLGYLGKIRLLVSLPSIFEYFGFIVGASGLTTTVISQFQMGNSWRIGVDQKESTALVTHGLYASSRNPIYFGILLFWIGLSITFPHPLLWLSAFVCWICIELIVRKIEEPYLMKEHGITFQNYVSRTNRYLPLIIRGKRS